MASSTPIARRARKVFGPLVSGYGMSEFGVGAAHRRPRLHRGAVRARPRASRRRATRSASSIPRRARDQPPGVPGEILVRGYTLMRGLLRASPRRRRQAIDAEGWMHTGDMGLLRARRPPALHGALQGHAEDRRRERRSDGGRGVPDGASRPSTWPPWSAIPDARLTEVGVAFVRREPGHAPHRGRRVAHCRGRIASFKIPRHVIFVDEFPMTSSGKIQKAKLREQARAALGTSRA